MMRRLVSPMGYNPSVFRWRGLVAVHRLDGEIVSGKEFADIGEAGK
jgi:hypothetical protein